MQITAEVLVSKEALVDFCVRVLRHVGVYKSDAHTTADVLVTADMRGIPSHGVARLRRYVNGIRCEMMRPWMDPCIISQTPCTATIDANAGLGQPVSKLAMLLAIRKALENGMATVVVRNSNHFGIAGYYSMMALQEGCIGIAMTNAAPLVVPTHGRNAILGTNARSLAAPAGEGLPFVNDMATSTVPRGKVEVHARNGQPLPAGWAIDQSGFPTTDPDLVLNNLRQRTGGGLTPLGGCGEEQSGHKGYGLAMEVEIFSALLSGAGFGTNVYPKAPDGTPLPANLGHVFMVWSISAFRPLKAFQSDHDELQRMLRGAGLAPGQDRIWIHGQKEAEAAERNAVCGIPLEAPVLADLKALADELDLAHGLE